MKKTLIFLAIAAVFSACETKPTSKYVQTAQNANAKSTIDPNLYASAPADGTYYGRGKVTKINMELGTVEIDHEDIPYLMPPMIMEFNVKDKNILKAVAVGDTVNFILEYKHPTETVVDISKSP